jgi:hypothetical protein
MLTHTIPNSGYYETGYATRQMAQQGFFLKTDVDRLDFLLNLAYPTRQSSNPTFHYTGKRVRPNPSWGKTSRLLEREWPWNTSKQSLAWVNN